MPGAELLSCRGCCLWYGSPRATASLVPGDPASWPRGDLAHLPAGCQHWTPEGAGSGGTDLILRMAHPGVLSSVLLHLSPLRPPATPRSRQSDSLGEGRVEAPSSAALLCFPLLLQLFSGSFLPHACSLCSPRVPGEILPGHQGQLQLLWPWLMERAFPHSFLKVFWTMPVSCQVVLVGLSITSPLLSHDTDRSENPLPLDTGRG